MPDKIGDAIQNPFQNAIPESTASVQPYDWLQLHQIHFWKGHEPQAKEDRRYIDKTLETVVRRSLLVPKTVSEFEIHKLGP